MRTSANLDGPEHPDLHRRRAPRRLSPGHGALRALMTRMRAVLPARIVGRRRFARWQMPRARRLGLVRIAAAHHFP